MCPHHTAVCCLLGLRPLLAKGDKGKFQHGNSDISAWLILFTQGVWLCGSIYIFIFSSTHPILHYYPLCLFGMIFQATDWRLNQFFNRSSRRIIHTSPLLFLSFCLIKRLNSLIHSCCKLSAHKSVTIAHYLSRYSYSTLWEYVINFVEYVYRIWVLWYKWMYLTLQSCLNLIHIMRSTGTTNGK